MSIKLDVAEYCHSCDRFEPVKTCQTFHTFHPILGEQVYSETRVVCANKRDCEMMYRFIKDHMNDSEVGRK